MVLWVRQAGKRMRGLGALALDVNSNFIPAGFVNVVKLITCLSLSFLICKTKVIYIPFHRLIAKNLSIIHLQCWAQF